MMQDVSSKSAAPGAGQNAGVSGEMIDPKRDDSPDGQAGKPGPASIATYEAVAAAAESLLQQGRKPSAIRVREIIGGGSFSTIGPLLKRWKDSRPASLPGVVELPPELKQNVDQAIANLRPALSRAMLDIRAVAELEGEQARQESDVALADLEASHERETARLQTEIAGRDEALAEAAGRIGQQDEALKAAADRISELSRELDASRTALDAEKLARAAAEAQVEERGARIADLDARLARAAEEAEAQRQDARVERERAASETARLNAELAGLRQTSASQASRIGSLEAELKASAQELQRLVGETQAISEAKAALEARHQALQADLEATRSDLAVSRETVRSAQERIEEMQASLQRSDEEHRLLGRALADAETATADLRGRLAAADRRVETLEGERDNALGQVSALKESASAQAARLEAALAMIADRDSRIAGLSSEISRLQEQVAGLERRTGELQATVEAQARTIASQAPEQSKKADQGRGADKAGDQKNRRGSGRRS